MASKRVVILRSIPGAGKSYLSERISMEASQKGETSAILSTDSLFCVGGKYCFNKEKLHSFHKVNYDRFELAISAGINVIIIDNTNTTFKEFQNYVSHAILFGYEIEIREPETSWKYDVDECTKRNGHGVPREVIQRMLDRWEDTKTCLLKIEEIRKLYEN